jgi:CBS-domain-containing membrane protein
MPKNVTAQPRNVIGGHLVGVISGGACALLFISFGNDSEFIHIIFASVSVGIAIFIMVVTDTEHPPGCSTSLGLTVHALVPLDVALYGVFILISATIMAMVKHALNPQLKDLV